MSEWREVKLGDCVVVNKQTLPRDYQGKIRYIDISSVSEGVLNGYNEIEYQDAPSRARRLVEDGDIIYSTVRPNLKGYYKFNDRVMESTVVSTGFIVLSKTKYASIDYIYYYITEDSFVNYLTNVAKGAAYPAVGIDDFKKAKIRVPNLETQRKIANVLSTYDKLIENNNRRIEILEQTAEELYKEWFVRMRFPGYENAKFHKGIPEEWEIKKVEEIISFDIGGGWGEESLMNDFTEQAYVIRGTDIPNMKYGEFNYELLRYHKKSNLKSRKLESTDIIFEASGGSKDQRLGRTFYVTEEILSMYDNDVICASFCKLIKFEDKYLSWFFYNYLRYAYQTEILSTFEVQSTGISNFGFSKFKKHHQLLVPTSNVMEQFYKLTYPMLLEMQKLGNKNQNLIKQRDLLLPRLMNGTITVK